MKQFAQCHHASAEQSSVLRRSWESPDPLLRTLGVRYLQIGGDIWNRCHEGWLNIDAAFKSEGLHGESQFGTDDKCGNNMAISFSEITVLPFASNSVQMVYSEHMIEHMLPDAGSNLLHEAYRVLVPDGILRLATPDLGRYMLGYVESGARGQGGTNAFLRVHSQRFGPMQQPRNRPPTDATIVNNIFRNYGHKWVYDFEELRSRAVDAGIAAEDVCQSDRVGRGLPQALQRARDRATHPRNESLACWLDQAVREDESLYVHLVKRRPWPPSNRSHVPPFCRPVRDWLPCHPGTRGRGGRRRGAGVMGL